MSGAGVQFFQVCFLTADVNFVTADVSFRSRSPKSKMSQNHIDSRKLQNIKFLSPRDHSTLRQRVATAAVAEEAAGDSRFAHPARAAGDSRFAHPARQPVLAPGDGCDIYTHILTFKCGANSACDNWQVQGHAGRQ